MSETAILLCGVACVAGCARELTGLVAGARRAPRARRADTGAPLPLRRERRRGGRRTTDRRAARFRARYSMA